MKKITKSKAIKAFKVFNPDWTCRGFQFTVGKHYKHSGNVSACSSGFHACSQVADCFSYYSFDSGNKVAEVLLWGQIDIHDEDSKIAAENIEIIRELSWQEVLVLANTGKDCTGLKNSGDRNSGNRNSGNRNSGNRNSGYGNSGNRNSGDGNSGYGNSGNRNSGYGNSGNGNSGDRNSGDGNSGYGNSGDRNSGVFCENEPFITSFDLPTTLRFDEIDHPTLWNYDKEVWVYSENMSETEKELNPSHITTGGYLKSIPYKEMWQNGWAKDSDENKRKFFNLPNFDIEKFERITGIEAKADFERLTK